MTVISLDQVRQARAEQLAAATADAKRLVEASVAYARSLAADAYTTTVALPDPDRQLHLAVERFVLRRGLTQSRRSWRREYGKEPDHRA